MDAQTLLQEVGAERPVISHGMGTFLVDEKGRSYLDGSSGAMTVSLGHRHSGVLAAMNQQASQVAFTYRSQFDNRPAQDLAQRLVELAPSNISSIAYVNSGSEATEFAIRSAVNYWRQKLQPNKVKILGRDTSYHGMTMGAMSVSGHPERRDDYGTLLHDFAVLPRTQRCGVGQEGLSQDQFCESLIDQVEQTLITADPDSVAGIIMEPIVGASGGVLVPPFGYLRRVRELCDRYEVLLIADEVVTGIGRTGSWFACEREDMLPDFITVGKGVSSGYYPLAGVLCSETTTEMLKRAPGRIPFGHTYSGNPLGASVGMAVLDAIEKGNLLENARDRGAQLGRGLQRLSDRFDHLEDVRGRGLLWGFEFDIDPATKETSHPSLSVSQRFADTCLQHGLVIYPAGISPSSNAAIVSPPLNVTADEIDDILHRLEAAVADFNALLFGD